jgi:Lrp/AsnC family leucine-responsive transcriptional regulator
VAKETGGVVFAVDHWADNNDVGLYIESGGINVFEQFKAAVQVRPEIMECHMVAGGFDYLLKTRAADMNAYREFAGTVLWQLPGVRETRTYAVMEEVKNTTALAL